MRFSQTLLAVASFALFNSVEARRGPSRWSVERTKNVQDRLERVYGKGLIGMRHPETGRIDPERFGWDNRVTGGAPLGSSISRTINDNLTIDATGLAAFWLGFTIGMQYNGLDRESLASLPNSDTPLTNCFASMYSLVTSFDTAAYNLSTINSEPGSFKGFDVLVIDPTHIIGDIFVNFEMCEIALIIDQFKMMASLDWASVGDNLTREILVIAVENPKARKEMMKVQDAAVCAQGEYKDYQKENENGEGSDDEFEEWGEDEDPSLNFAADAGEAASAGVECFALVDRFTIGEISGNLFSSFFNNELKPLI